MSRGVRLEGLERRYGLTSAVSFVDLEVAEGELVALLGPSGCGKTTTLRMVAGFVPPTKGRVHIGGRDVTGLPPYRRDTGMVFQSYALFPHMTVAENIAFGLRRRRVGRDVIRRRVAEIIRTLQLAGLEQRLPRELSGGQQQRVAVGRALVINPSVLLLDEPFSNLDAQLRETTRVELRRLQQASGITTLFVTHDQAEAMAIADRVAVMEAGRIAQVGSPVEIYARPVNRFVANFIGRANLIEARVTGRNDGRCKAVAGDGLELSASEPPRSMAPVVTFLLRPEAIRLQPPATSGANPHPLVNGAVAKIDYVSFLGASATVEITTAAGRRLIVETAGPDAVGRKPGELVVARWDEASLVPLED